MPSKFILRSITTEREQVMVPGNSSRFFSIEGMDFANNPNKTDEKNVEWTSQKGVRHGFQMIDVKGGIVRASRNLEPFEELLLVNGRVLSEYDRITG